MGERVRISICMSLSGLIFNFPSALRKGLIHTPCFSSLFHGCMQGLIDRQSASASSMLLVEVRVGVVEDSVDAERRSMDTFVNRAFFSTRHACVFFHFPVLR